MSRTGRSSMLLVLIAVLMAGFSLAVMAAEGDQSTADTVGGSTTTSIDTGLTPAVPISEDQTAAPQPDWTYRYLIPTGLVLAAVVIVMTAIKYFTDVVRKRYRIVEE